MALASVAMAQEAAAVPAMLLQPPAPKTQTCNPNAKPLPADPVEEAVVKIEEKLNIGGCNPDQIGEVMQLVMDLAAKASANKPCPPPNVKVMQQGDTIVITGTVDGSPIPEDACKCAEPCGPECGCGACEDKKPATCGGDCNCGCNAGKDDCACGDRK